MDNQQLAELSRDLELHPWFRYGSYPLAQCVMRIGAIQALLAQKGIVTQEELDDTAGLYGKILLERLEENAKEHYDDRAGEST